MRVVTPLSMDQCHGIRKFDTSSVRRAGVSPSRSIYGTNPAPGIRVGACEKSLQELDVPGESAEATGRTPGYVPHDLPLALKA